MQKNILGLLLLLTTRVVSAEIDVPGSGGSSGVATSMSPSTSLVLYDEFLAGTTAGNTNVAATVAGGIINIENNPAIIDSMHPGIIFIGTSGSATGTASLHYNVALDGIALGGGQLTFETLLYLPDLSTVAEEYVLRIGLGDNTGLGAHTDGVYFTYDRLLSVNWTRTAVSNGGESLTPTAVAVAEDVWIKLKIVVNAAGTSAEYFINNVSVGSETDIPTTSDRRCNVVLKIQKTNGTSNRQASIDYIYLQQNLGR